MTRLFTLIQYCLAGRTPLWLHWGTMSLGNEQLHLKTLSHRVLCCTVLALFFCALTNLLRQTNTNLLSVAASLSHSISISICIPFPSISTRHFSFTPLLTHLIATLDNFHSPCPHARKVRRHPRVGGASSTVPVSTGPLCLRPSVDSMEQGLHPIPLAQH